MKQLPVITCRFVLKSFVVVSLQERLNEFENEKALSVLSACLAEMESSKNADALKQGLKYDSLSSFKDAVCRFVKRRLPSRICNNPILEKRHQPVINDTGVQ